MEKFDKAKENIKVLIAPIEGFDEVENRYKSLSEAEDQVKEELNEFIKEKLKELNEKYTRQKHDQWLSSVNAFTEQNIGRIEKWLKEIYEGKYGRGELAMVTSHVVEIPKRLMRVIPISNPKKDGKKDKEIRQLSEKGIVIGNVIQQPKKGPLFTKTDNRYTSYSISSEHLTGSSHYGIDDFFDEFDFAEVNFDLSTKEELDDFFKKMIEQHWSIADMLEIFPKDYKPEFRLGEVLNFGGCDHHSGHIDGVQVVLPTGRLAVFSKYKGERNYDEYTFWGVLEDPKIKPRWSASIGSWAGERLQPPTKEEIIFLKGEGYDTDEKNELENQKKPKQIDGGYTEEEYDD